MVACVCVLGRKVEAKRTGAVKREDAPRGFKWILPPLSPAKIGRDKFTSLPPLHGREMETVYENKFNQSGTGHLF